MKLTINLSRRQIDGLRNFLQKKYKSKKKVETLARVYLLEFIAAELKRESDAAEDAALNELLGIGQHIKYKLIKGEV